MSTQRPQTGSRRSARQKRHARLPVVYETSAGGVVIRRIRGQWHVALLKTRHRRGEVWVLPKGHVERATGETRDAAAVREVKEELGISEVRILRKLGIVRWEFLGERQEVTGSPKSPPKQGQAVRIVKTVHHYLMEGLSERIRPQAEEGLLAARWVPYRTALRMLAYPTDRSVVARAFRVNTKGPDEPRGTA